MHETSMIVSKVLVHEPDKAQLQILKEICEENNLIGLRVCAKHLNIGLEEAKNEFHDILASNVDLGALFLSEAAEDSGICGLDLCVHIHKTRPDLPIFLRRTSDIPLTEMQSHAIAGTFPSGDKDTINRLVKEFIYSTYYPRELAQGIQDISSKAFESLIPGIVIRHEYPYLVKDQLIFGELMSMIPLDSDWCRGYMMLQTSEYELRELMRSENTALHTLSPNWKDFNAILNEVTNLIWGKIRACYFSETSNNTSQQTQVPILINHAQKHISFGTTEPQLCFKYRLHDPKHSFNDIVIVQRFVFNLVWSPEHFEDNDKIIENFVEGGELEFF